MEETNENNFSNEEQKAYARACTEVLEILKDAPQSDIDKIPKELLEALESKKDKTYEFKTDSYMTFENEDISDIARVILMQIFKEYILNPNIEVNKEEVKESCEEQEKISDNISMYNEDQNDSIEENTTELALVEIKKEPLYKRIINFFKKLFNIGMKNKNELEEEV